jgi:hypothetical protein
MHNGQCMISEGIVDFKPIKLPPKIDEGDNILEPLKPL